MRYLTEEHYMEAEKNGISRNHAYRRFYRSHWTIEDTITIPVKRNKYQDYWSICEQNGISMQLFYERIHKGYTPEDASTRAKTKGGRPRKVVKDESNIP